MPTDALFEPRAERRRARFLPSLELGRKGVMTKDEHEPFRAKRKYHEVKGD